MRYGDYETERNFQRIYGTLDSQVKRSILTNLEHAQESVHRLSPWLTGGLSQNEMSDSSLEDYLDKLEDDLNKVDSLLEEGGFEPYFCAKCLRMCRQKDSADEKKASVRDKGILLSDLRAAERPQRERDHGSCF